MIRLLRCPMARAALFTRLDVRGVWLLIFAARYVGGGVVSVDDERSLIWWLPTILDVALWTGIGLFAVWQAFRIPGERWWVWGVLFVPPFMRLVAVWLAVRAHHQSLWDATGATLTNLSLMAAVMWAATMSNRHIPPIAEAPSD